MGLDKGRVNQRKPDEVDFCIVTIIVCSFIHTVLVSL